VAFSGFAVGVVFTAANIRRAAMSRELLVHDNRFSALGFSIFYPFVRSAAGRQLLHGTHL
jgi:hypothetical protein